MNYALKPIAWQLSAFDLKFNILLQLFAATFDDLRFTLNWLIDYIVRQPYVYMYVCAAYCS